MFSSKTPPLRPVRILPRSIVLFNYIFPSNHIHRPLGLISLFNCIDRPLGQPCTTAFPPLQNIPCIGNGVFLQNTPCICSVVFLQNTTCIGKHLHYKKVAIKDISPLNYSIGPSSWQSARRCTTTSTAFPLHTNSHGERERVGDRCICSLGCFAVTQRNKSIKVNLRSKNGACGLHRRRAHHQPLRLDQMLHFQTSDSP